MTNVEAEPKPQTVEPLFSTEFRDKIKTIFNLRNFSDLKSFEPERISQEISNVWNEVFTIAQELNIGKLTKDGMKLESAFHDHYGSLRLRALDVSHGKATIDVNRYNSPDWIEKTEFNFRLGVPLILDRINNHFKDDSGWKEFAIELSEVGDIRQVSFQERQLGDLSIQSKLIWRNS